MYRMDRPTQDGRMHKMGRLANDDIPQEMDIYDLNKQVRAYRRNQSNHIGKMFSGSLSRAAMRYESTGQRSIGRPRKR